MKLPTASFDLHKWQVHMVRFSASSGSVLISWMAPACFWAWTWNTGKKFFTECWRRWTSIRVGSMEKVSNVCVETGVQGITGNRSTLVWQKMIICSPDTVELLFLNQPLFLLSPGLTRCQLGLTPFLLSPALFSTHVRHHLLPQAFLASLPTLGYWVSYNLCYWLHPIVLHHVSVSLSFLIGFELPENELQCLEQGRCSIDTHGINKLINIMWRGCSQQWCWWFMCGWLGRPLSLLLSSSKCSAYMCACVCMYLHIYMHVCVFTCVHIYMCVYVCINFF